MNDERKINSEIKVQVKDLTLFRERLNQLGADFKGTDHQKDTYFKVSQGRLKLREGNIENALIFYDRDDDSFPKKSRIILVRSSTPELREILFRSLEILVVVEKQREIYFIDNVKFHLDVVPKLGKFVEIEVMGGPEADLEELNTTLKHYVELLKLPTDKQVKFSYSDLLLMLDSN